MAVDILQSTFEGAARQLIIMLQEACSGPLRDAARTQGAAFAELRAEDLRPVVLKDFKVRRPAACRAELQAAALPDRRQRRTSSDYDRRCWLGVPIQLPC